MLSSDEKPREPPSKRNSDDVLVRLDAVPIEAVMKMARPLRNDVDKLIEPVKVL